MAIKNNDMGGRSENQKFKSLLVAQYLLKYSDEDHAVKTFLEAYGISAESHSVQREIRLLNRLFEIDTDLEINVEEWERLSYYIEYDKSQHKNLRQHVCAAFSAVYLIQIPFIFSLPILQERSRNRGFRRACRYDGDCLS